MTVVDWAATWNPVPDERPCSVWLPEPRPRPGTHAQTSTACRPSTPVALTLTPAQARDLPRWLPHLLAGTALSPGDRVTVDLGESASVHLSGLALLLGVLWRRVGPHGEVAVTGGTRGLRAQLTCLDMPGACRTAVHGQPSPATPTASAPVPAPAVPSGLVGPALPVVVPAPRLVLAGDVNLTVDLRTQARLNELVECGPRTLEVDVSQVTRLSVSSLRLLLAADARLRARGGRVLLRGVSPPVVRLLAITSTSWLADEHSVERNRAATPQRAVAASAGRHAVPGAAHVQAEAMSTGRDRRDAA